MDLRELHMRASDRIDAALKNVCDPSLREIGSVGRVGKGHVPEKSLRESEEVVVGVTTAGGDVKAAVCRAVEAIGGWESTLRAQDKVLIKPNYNSPDSPPGSTDVEFLAAVIELLREGGYREVMVGDCSGLLWHPTMDVFEKTGVLRRMKEMSVPLISFDYGPWVEVPVEGEYLDSVTIPQAVIECDKLIYLPCMKTHRLARFTMSLKLGVGLLHPALRPFTLHRENLEEKCAELNLGVRPDLIIMDGRVAFVTGGPDDGRRVYPDLVLASDDPVGMDVEGVKTLQSYQGENLLNMEVQELPLISHACKLGLGSFSYRVKRV